jgi:hypothetical protein
MRPVTDIHFVWSGNDGALWNMHPANRGTRRRGIVDRCDRFRNRSPGNPQVRATKKVTRRTMTYSARGMQQKKQRMIVNYKSKVKLVDIPNANDCVVQSQGFPAHGRPNTLPAASPAGFLDGWTGSETGPRDDALSHHSAWHLGS